MPFQVSGAVAVMVTGIFLLPSLNNSLSTLLPITSNAFAQLALSTRVMAATVCVTVAPCEVATVAIDFVSGQPTTLLNSTDTSGPSSVFFDDNGRLIAALSSLNPAAGPSSLYFYDGLSLNQLGGLDLVFPFGSDGQPLSNVWVQGAGACGQKLYVAWGGSPDNNDQTASYLQSYSFVPDFSLPPQLLDQLEIPGGVLASQLDVTCQISFPPLGLRDFVLVSHNLGVLVAAMTKDGKVDASETVGGIDAAGVAIVDTATSGSQNTLTALASTSTGDCQVVKLKLFGFGMFTGPHGRIASTSATCYTSSSGNTLQRGQIALLPTYTL
jgi:hypothetical protein